MPIRKIILLVWIERLLVINFLLSDINQDLEILYDSWVS